MPRLRVADKDYATYLIIMNGDEQCFVGSVVGLR